MRALLAVLLMLPGCGERRSFDERYADTQRDLEDRARQQDAALAAAENSALTNANKN